MDSQQGMTGQSGTNALPARSKLVAARRVLWNFLRERTRALAVARSALRRRLGNFLRASDGSRLLRILRSAALAGAVAAALAAPSSAWAQAIELADVARGKGGFIVRGEGEPGSGAGASVAAAGDVNGDGIPDLIVGGRFCPYYCYSAPTYVVFGKPDGTIVELSEVLAGRGAVRGEDALDISDGIRLLGYLFLGSPEPPCLDAADADDSGGLNIADAVRVIGYLFLGGDAPPDPGPTTCGPDPTPDDLGCATATRGCAM